MSALQDYINQITDKALREGIQREVDRLLQNKKFGLVFENHQPEYTPLWGARIAEQCTVARKDAIGGTLYTVVKKNERKAWCLPQGGKGGEGSGEVSFDEIGLPVQSTGMTLPCGSTAIWQK